MDKLDVLERVFGYREFRPGQETLIDGALAGRDVFGIMPTGGGKSLCYQVPALLFPGISLVVCPLISLMRDQVMALKAAGVPAAYINSTLTGPQMQAVYRNLLAGRYKIVYVAPERLDYPGFGNVAANLDISFLAVDEAHCISQWGQDFRPSYLRIVQFIDALPRRPVVGAFTATATRQVQEDVERILKLKDPVRMVTGFDRPNLFFQVLHPDRKDTQLRRLLRERGGKSGIIYCSTRKNVETVCEDLITQGYAATRYHAGLPEEERTANQEDFLYDRKTIMVATNAFGMGIDKSNVSFVIHYNMPKSIEAYYQEAGRAGRDGAEADCILLYSGQDVAIARFLIENSASENDEMDPQQRRAIQEQDYARLEAMVGYCKTRNCLRGYILDYFGQKHGMVCGNCGSCVGNTKTVDITREAQMVLSCVRRAYDMLGYWMGAGTICDILRGKKSKRVLGKGLDSLSTYGLMAKHSQERVRGILDQLEADGYLVTRQEHQTLELTTQAGDVLYKGKRVFMRVPEEPLSPETSGGPRMPGERSTPVGASVTAKLDAEDTELFEVLKGLRSELAKKAGIPPFMVFSNATLMDMVKKKPKTPSEFRRVSGVGEIKASWYAEDFTSAVRRYLEEQNGGAE